LFEIDVQEPSESVFVPTASYDTVIDREKLRGVYPVSTDSLHKSVSCPSSMFRIPSNSSEYSDSSGYYSGSRTGHLPENSNEVEYIESYGRSSTASAINLKTGASVISLDFPSSSSSSKSGSSKKSANQRSKKAKGGSKRAGKDKKPKKTTKDSQSGQDGMGCFTNALCITPIPTVIDQDDDYDPNISPCEDDEDVFDIKPDPLLYQEMGRATKSVYKFEKLAYPDLCGARSPLDIEPLYHRKFGVQRSVTVYI
jgi:hypothetical protein